MAFLTLKRGFKFEPMMYDHDSPCKRARYSSPDEMLLEPSSPASEPSLKMTPRKLNFTIDQQVQRVIHMKQSPELKIEQENNYQHQPVDHVMNAPSNGNSIGNDGVITTTTTTSEVTSDVNFSNNSDTTDKVVKPLFTYSQLVLICQRKLEEQRAKIREEYEQVLTEKSSEQYDTFVKFTYDQMRKNLASTSRPSYFS